MLRTIVHIDEEKCNGCGLCVDACHEGAIGLVGGKAKLLRDDYCDGLGDCLPVCPTDAISLEERDALAYDEAQVLANIAAKQTSTAGCPGIAAKSLDRKASGAPVSEGSQGSTQANTGTSEKRRTLESELMQWPVQIKLAPINAPYFDGEKLLIAADCTAYAYADFHARYMKNHITLIGCPKLDEGNYVEKLTEILKQNDIKSVTVARMEVPCCGGIENAVKLALQNSGKMIPWQVVTISTDGRILDE